MVIFFGSAGSGKSVQGQLLATSQNWRWLSMGQLLRDTKDAEILSILGEGKLIPYERTNEILTEALQQTGGDRGVVLEGYPRQLEQAEWLITNQPHNGHSVQAVIVLEVPPEEAIKRLSLRKRADDTPAAINERLRTYSAEISPILDYLDAQKVKIIHVDGTGAVEEIHDRIRKELRVCGLI